MLIVRNKENISRKEVWVSGDSECCWDILPADFTNVLNYLSLI